MDKNDYIPREAVIQLAYNHGCHATYDDPFPEEIMAVDVDDIENIPASDVAEIVYCKDCELRATEYCGYNSCSPAGLGGVKDYFFCADGKSKSYKLRELKEKNVEKQFVNELSLV